MRDMQKITKGGMWSVEVGKTVKGLHINLLMDGDQAINEYVLSGIWRVPGLAIWAEEVGIESARTVAAYMTKRQGMPSIEEYDGRLYGTFGSWRKVGEFAKDKASPPIIQGAQMEYELSKIGVNPTANQEIRPLSKDGYRALAENYLPRLHDIVRSGKKAP